MRNLAARITAAIFLLAASSTAFAHPGHDVSGLAVGLMHPFLGFDHLLAMVAVGLWAAQNDKSNGGGRKVWLLPAAFMLMLAFGAGVAMLWPSLPMVEPGIAVSVLASGLLVALSLQLPALLGIVITGLFGVLHGYAHGLELPESAAPAAYAFGFLAATALLHISGIASVVAARHHYALLSRMAGTSIAISGAYLLALT